MKIKLNQEFIDSDEFTYWCMFFMVIFVITIAIILIIYPNLFPYFIGISFLFMVGKFLKNLIKIEK